MDRQKMRFTREQRMAIVREYETSFLTCVELAVKYGFKSPYSLYFYRFVELSAAVFCFRRYSAVHACFFSFQAFAKRRPFFFFRQI